jgi:iron complex outermembrane receptor protein
VSPRDGGWTASLFVKNVTNKLVVASMKPGSTVVGSPLNGYLEEPRTYGVTVGYKF